MGQLYLPGSLTQISDHFSPLELLPVCFKPWSSPYHIAITGLPSQRIEDILKIALTVFFSKYMPKKEKEKYVPDHITPLLKILQRFLISIEVKAKDLK